jgi:hypothetical protein
MIPRCVYLGSEPYISKKKEKKEKILESRFSFLKNNGRQLVL